MINVNPFIIVCLVRGWIFREVEFATVRCTLSVEWCPIWGLLSIPWCCDVWGVSGGFLIEPRKTLVSRTAKKNWTFFLAVRETSVFRLHQGLIQNPPETPRTSLLVKDICRCEDVGKGSDHLCFFLRIFSVFLENFLSFLWPIGVLVACTEKTSIPFPFILNGIRLWWQFSFRFWTKWNSIWFKIERKPVTTIVSHWICKKKDI